MPRQPVVDPVTRIISPPTVVEPLVAPATELLAAPAAPLAATPVTARPDAGQRASLSRNHKICCGSPEASWRSSRSSSCFSSAPSWLRLSARHPWSRRSRPIAVAEPFAEPYRRARAPLRPRSPGRSLPAPRLGRAARRRVPHRLRLALGGGIHRRRLCRTASRPARVPRHLRARRLRCLPRSRGPAGSDRAGLQRAERHRLHGGGRIQRHPVRRSFPATEEQWKQDRSYFCFVDRSSGDALQGSVAVPQG